jgi:hypothetical protein
MWAYFFNTNILSYLVWPVQSPHHWETKSQLLSLTKSWLILIKVGSWLFYAKNKIWDLCWGLGLAFCLTQISTQVPSLTSQKCCHVSIHVILGNHDLGPCVNWGLGLGPMWTSPFTYLSHAYVHKMTLWPQMSSYWGFPRKWPTSICQYITESMTLLLCDQARLNKEGDSYYTNSDHREKRVAPPPFSLPCWLWPQP